MYKFVLWFEYFRIYICIRTFTKNLVFLMLLKRENFIKPLLKKEGPPLSIVYDVVVLNSSRKNAEMQIYFFCLTYITV